ncbi:MAG: LysM peptidoglycan-binding domain-containing protein [Pseudomonadota bacterium]
MAARRSLALCLAGVALASGARAEDVAAPDGREKSGYAVLEFFESGLRVVMHAEPSSATAAACTSFPAGLGRDGSYRGELARVVAETVREGGRRARGAHFTRLVESRGGRTEVTLDGDRAVFCTVVPAHELPLALWVESGRHRPHALTEENFAARVTARRLGGEHDRAEEVHRRARWLAFPLVGGLSPTSMEPTLEEARRFHREHYDLAGAVLAIAGNFEPNAIRDVVDELFEHRDASSVDLPPPRAPRQTSPRYMAVEAADLRAPIYERAWVVPGAETREHRALELLAELLSGPTSPLYEPLVGSGNALDVRGRIDRSQGEALFAIQVFGGAPAVTNDLESRIDAVLDRVRDGTMSTDAIARARRRLELRSRFALQESVEQARWLAARVALGLAPDPRAMDRELASITAEEIRRVANRFLPAARHVVVELLPREAREPFRLVGPRVHVVRPGDALARIARREGTSVAELARLNGIDPKRPLRPGQKIRLPTGKAKARAGRVHVVKKGDTLIGIAKRYGVTVEAIARQNGFGNQRAIRIGETLRIPPKR